MKCELLELGELKRLGDVVREVALAESGHAKARREPEGRRRLRWCLQHIRCIYVDAAINLLEVVEGGDSEPSIHNGGVVLQVLCGEAKAAAGAPVGGEDAGDDIDGAKVTAVEVERGGAPEMAPPVGEDLGAGGILGGEERDDLT